jgi:PadR family transcriptional regulator, regulatory protein PadR
MFRALRCRANPSNAIRFKHGSIVLTDSTHIQLKKGILELCVLTLLAQNDSYGYQITSRLSDAIGMAEGTVYPLLRRMQKDELVDTYLTDSDAGPPRRYFKLTKAGHRTLVAKRAEWKAFKAALLDILGDDE